jgi:hypothetical protein
VRSCRLYIIAVVFLIFVLPDDLYAQKPRPKNLPGFESTKKIHFGFYFGVNNLDVNIKYKSNFLGNDTIYTARVQGQYGFNLGIITDLHLGDGFDLRFVPALVFGQRDFEYNVKLGNNTIETQRRMVESTFLDFPISLKYKSERVNNGRAFVMAGAKVAFDMASLKNVDKGNTKVIRLNPWDFSYHVGFGLDFYFEYFKFTPQITLNYGINNLLISDGTVYTSLIESINSKCFVLSLCFEG